MKFLLRNFALSTFVLAAGAIFAETPTVTVNFSRKISTADIPEIGGDVRCAAGANGYVYALNKATGEVYAINGDEIKTLDNKFLPSIKNNAGETIATLSTGITTDDAGNIIVLYANGAFWAYEPYGFAIMPADGSNIIYTGQVAAPEGYELNRLDVIGRAVGNVLDKGILYLAPSQYVSEPTAAGYIFEQGVATAMDHSSIALLCSGSNYGANLNVAVPAFNSINEQLDAKDINNALYVQQWNDGAVYYTINDGVSVKGDIPEPEGWIAGNAPGFDIINRNGQIYLCSIFGNPILNPSGITYRPANFQISNPNGSIVFATNNQTEGKTAINGGGLYVHPVSADQYEVYFWGGPKESVYATMATVEFIQPITSTVDIELLRYALDFNAGNAEVIGLASEVEVTDLVIPDYVEYDGIQYPVTSIRDHAFESKTNYLKGSLTIGNNLTYIGERAFYACSRLSGSLTFADNITSIGNSAFLGCYGLTGTLTLPNKLTTIGDQAFYGCSGFSGSLTIPDNVTSIGDKAFMNCYGLTGTLTLSNRLTTIGKYSFQYDSFSGSLTIPEKVTTIGEGAFSGCSKIIYLQILSQNLEINGGAFHSMTALESITCSATTPPNCIYDDNFSSIFSSSSYSKPLMVPDESIRAYRTATEWKNFTNITTLYTTVVLNYSELNMYIGDQVKLTASVQPANTTNPTIVWSSGNEDIAAVASDGTVRARRKGTTNIKATCGESSAICKVTVNPIVASTVTIDPEEVTLRIGQRRKLSATVLPANTTDPTIVWSTASEAIAEVAADGTVTAVGAGTANIKATCGDKSASCKVTVVGDQMPQPTAVKDYRNQCVNVTNPEAQRISVRIGQEVKTMDLPATIEVNPSMTELVITALATDAYRTDSEPLAVALEFFKAPRIEFNGHTIRFSLVDVPAGQSAPELLVYQDGNLIRTSTDLAGIDIIGFGTVAAAVQSDYMFRSEKTEMEINCFNTGLEAGARNGARLQNCFGTWGDSTDDYTNLRIVGTVNRADLTLLASLPNLTTLNLEATIDWNDSYDNVFPQSNIETLALAYSPLGILNGMERLTTVIWNRTDAKMAGGLISGNGNPNILVWVTNKDVAPVDATNIVVYSNLEGGLITSDNSRCQASAEKITLASGKPFNAFKELQAGHIEVTKEFTQKTQIGVCRGWETLALPFLASKITHESNGEMTPFASWDGLESSARPFWLYRSTSTGWIHSAAIEPGVPYIISVPNNPDYLNIYNLAGKVTFSADNVTLGTSTSQPHTTDWVDGSKFTATFMPVEGNILSLNSGEESSDLLPGSAFVAGLRTQPFGGYVTSSSAQRVMPLFGESDGIRLPQIAGNGELIVESPAPGTIRLLSTCDRVVTIYTVTGTVARIVQLQAGEVTTEENLARGFYFVGHNKVIVR